MASADRSSIPHQNQQPKCPRCHSSNTKFCYYNNYSLSQPRHLCKSCKRYWTRGGTLRNVPVGGGCRKNKRSSSIKRTITNVDDRPKPNLDQSAPSNNNLNPLYGLLQQNPRYPRSNVSRFDHQLVPPDQTSNLELGFSFSSPDLGDSTLVAANHGHNSVPLVSSYPSMFTNAGFTSSGDHTIASLLSSSIHQQPSFLGFAPYGDEGGSVVDNIQTEIPKNSTDWNNSFSGQNDNDHIKSLESSDPASFLWTITGGDGGEWHDPTSNVSVPSLI